MKRSTFNLKSRLVIAVIGLSALFPASAATINVNPGDSIQAAVNAAVSGDTINIAAGVYEEQVVVVEKDLTLLGEPGAVLKAPAAMTGTLVPYGSTRLTVLGVVLSEVNVSGLGFDGNRSGVVNAPLTGVYYRSSSGTLGVNLLANPVLGTASNAKVIANRISASTTLINVQPGVTGTKQHANKISP